LGDNGIELDSTWALSAVETKLNTNWTRFENYLSPKSNSWLSRYKLRTLKQEPGETVHSFVKKIRILVEECWFTSPDVNIIDALIFGSNSKRTQTKLVDKDTTLTLDTTLDITQTEEVTTNQIKEISPGTSTHVDPLNCDPPIRPRSPTILLCGCCSLEHDVSELSCPPLVQNVVHAEKRIPGEMSVVHQSDKKGKTKHGGQKLPKPSKRET